MTEELKKVLWSIFVQLSFLAAGIVLVGLGSNFYLGFGLACLIIYGKTIK
jgi:hypothetical protein